VLHDGRPEAHRIPAEREVVAQELLLFESAGAPDLDRLTDRNYRTGRLTVTVPRADAVIYAGLLESEKAPLQAIFGSAGRVEATGSMAVMGRTARAVGESLLRSYGLAFVLVTPFMMVLLRSVRRGLLSMIPNLLPLIATLGAMGALGVPLDVTTLMLGGIILGLAVDDTIHFMYGFQRSVGRSGDVEAAVTETLETTGAALLATSLVLAAGFLVFFMGELENVAHFGVLAAAATLVAFLADVLLAPAMLALLLRRRA